MSYQDQIDSAVEIIRQKYGIPSVLALAIDVAVLAVGAYLLLQSGILLTGVGFVFVMASLGGLLNKVLHGGSK